jgi:retron-type reverse transcriptase
MKQNFTQKLTKEVQNCWNPKNKKFENLFEVAFTEEALAAAYKEASKAKGAITPGGDGMTIDGINLGRIKKLATELKGGYWKPGKARRVMNPKKDTGKLRPLTILSGDDKIVNQAIKNVLTIIYEAPGVTNCEQSDQSIRFENSSHAFRPNRGCHTALQKTTTWGLVSWYSKVDIVKFYDSVDQNRLINLIRRHIDDRVIEDTIRKQFNIEVTGLEKGGPDTSKGKGIPQGSPLSPLLANIYLDPLDKEMRHIKFISDKGEGIKVTPEWTRETYVNARELAPAKTAAARRNLKRELYKKKVKEATKAGIQKYGEKDQEQTGGVYHRVFYVRYADDFLIGIRGPKTLAKRVMTKAQNLLREDLHLDVDNTNVTDARNQKVNFLGFEIKTPGRNHRSVVESRRILSFKKLRSKVQNRITIADQRLQKLAKDTITLTRAKELRKRLGKTMSKEAIRKAAEEIGKEEAKGTIQNLTKSEYTLKDGEMIKGWLKREGERLADSWIAKDHLDEAGAYEVIEAYEKLIEKMRANTSGEKMALLKNEEVRKAQEEGKPQHTVDRILFGQPQGLNPRIFIPMSKIKEKIRSWGMVKEKSFQPKANGIVFKYHDVAIIDHYRMKAQGLLEYYRPGINYHEVKKAVDYQMRYSLIHTLAGKHKKKVHEIIQEYGKTPSVHVPGKNSGEMYKLTGFLTPAEIQQKKRGFSIKEDPGQYVEIMNRPIAKLSLPKQLYKKCGVIGCLNNDIEVHHVRKLERQIKGYLVVSVKNKKEITKKPLQTIESALTRKQIPLCRSHHLELHAGKLDSRTLDKEYINAKVNIIGGGMTARLAQLSSSGTLKSKGKKSESSEKKSKS